jgi:2-polyprenyl-3-methyl-5-hydroxy-6-metoxy-1,4-benzoquinol methylase
MKKRLLNLLKNLPIDLGQGAHRHTTQGKLIAVSLVPNGHGKTALDVGCGEGEQTRWLQSRGYTVSSIDTKSALTAASSWTPTIGCIFPMTASTSSGVVK